IRRKSRAGAASRGGWRSTNGAGAIARPAADTRAWGNYVPARGIQRLAAWESDQLVGGQYEITISPNPAPWGGLGPVRRIGACRPMQQQDRTIREGRAPIRKQSRRRTDGAPINWRTTRSPTGARFGEAGRGARASIVRCGHGAREAARPAR